MRLLPFVIVIGLLLSGYAYYVEAKAAYAKQMGQQYTALCDIGMFSCTKVFSSEFGHLTQFFGLPPISNAAVGVAFYLVELAVERHTTLLTLMAVSAAIGSVGLFTLLTVVMKDFCVVCFSIYVVNAIVAVTAVRRFKKKRVMSKID